MDGSGTADDPWQLTTAPGSSSYTMYKDEAADPPLLVCQVGSTKLTYLLSAIDDLPPGCKEQGDWVPLGAADEKKDAAEGTVEAFGPRRGQPGRRLVRPAEGLPRPVRDVPPAAARGARAWSSWSTTPATTGCVLCRVAPWILSSTTSTWTQAPSPEALVALFEGQWTSALPGLPSGEVPLFSRRARPVGHRPRRRDDRQAGAGARAAGGRPHLHARAGRGRRDPRHRGQHPVLPPVPARPAALRPGPHHVPARQLRARGCRRPTRRGTTWLSRPGCSTTCPTRSAVLDAICRTGDQVYLWTHYLDFEVMPRTDRRYKRWFIGEEEHEFRGRRTRCTAARTRRTPPTSRSSSAACTPPRRGSRGRPSSTSSRHTGSRSRSPTRSPTTATGRRHRSTRRRLTRCPRPQRSRSRPVAAPSGSPARTG